MSNALENTASYAALQAKDAEYLAEIGKETPDPAVVKQLAEEGRALGAQCRKEAGLAF